jgi:hypothetical protein
VTVPDFSSHFSLVNFLPGSVFSTGKSCKATVTTDEKGVAVVKMKNEHNHESGEKKVEVKQLRVRIKKQSGYITSRPSKIIRQEIQNNISIF